MGSMPFWTGIGDKPLSLSSTGATPSATASPSPGSGSSSGTGTSSDNGGFGSGSGSGSGPGSGSGTGSADPGPDQGPDSRPGVSGAGGAGFDFSEASRARVVHGILAAMAMVVFFPTGAVLVRFLEGRSALWAHAVVQIFAVSVYVAAVAVGFHLAQEVRGVGVDFVSDGGCSKLMGRVADDRIVYSWATCESTTTPSSASSCSRACSSSRCSGSYTTSDSRRRHGGRCGRTCTRSTGGWP